MDYFELEVSKASQALIARINYNYDWQGVIRAHVILFKYTHILHGEREVEKLSLCTGELVEMYKGPDDVETSATLLYVYHRHEISPWETRGKKCDLSSMMTTFSCQRQHVSICFFYFAGKWRWLQRTVKHQDGAGRHGSSRQFEGKPHLQTLP